MPWCRAVRPVQQTGHKQPAGRMIGRDCGAFRLDHRAKARLVASFLGWMLEAFDFFLMVFVLNDIAREFDTDITG
jgi:hypothetical protein